MKAIRCDLPAELESIELHPLADLHLGDQCCDFKLIQSWLEHIKNTPNAYCILNGDLMDAAITSSIGDTYGANLQPMEQLKQCVLLFEPIREKTLCITSGNHENRIYRTDGVDLTEIMAAQLGLADKYTPTTALLFIRFGRDERRAQDKSHNRKLCYTAYVTHGSGGGRKEGGKVNRLADLAAIVDADIYIHSHTHLPVIFKERYFRTDMSNSAVKPVDKLFCNTSSALLYGGYGDRQGYKPSSNANPVILLDGRRKSMKAIL